MWHAQDSFAANGTYYVEIARKIYLEVFGVDMISTDKFLLSF